MSDRCKHCIPSYWKGHQRGQAEAADEIQRLRAKLEAVYRVLQPGQFLTCHKAKRLLEEGYRDVAACGKCEICLYTKSVRELENGGGDGD